MFAYAHVKWFYGQSEHMYLIELFYNESFLKKIFPAYGNSRCIYL